MASKWNRAAALLTAVGLLSGLGAGSSAAQSATGRTSAAKTSETFHYNVYGIPAKLKRGKSIHARVWFMEHSPDRMQIGEFLMELGAPVGSRSYRGVSVRLLNPFTGRWQNPTRNDHDGGYWFWPGQDFILKPNVWYHVDVQFAFASTATTGEWQVFPQVIGGYQLINTHGVPQPDTLDLVGRNPLLRVYR